MNPQKDPTQIIPHTAGQTPSGRGILKKSSGVTVTSHDASQNCPCSKLWGTRHGLCTSKKHEFNTSDVFNRKYQSSYSYLLGFKPCTDTSTNCSASNSCYLLSSCPSSKLEPCLSARNSLGVVDRWPLRQDLCSYSPPSCRVRIASISNSLTGCRGMNCTPTSICDVFAFLSERYERDRAAHDGHSTASRKGSKQSISRRSSVSRGPYKARDIAEDKDDEGQVVGRMESSSRKSSSSVSRGPSKARDVAENKSDEGQVVSRMESFSRKSSYIPPIIMLDRAASVMTPEPSPCIFDQGMVTDPLMTDVFTQMEEECICPNLDRSTSTEALQTVDKFTEFIVETRDVLVSTSFIEAERIQEELEAQLEAQEAAQQALQDQIETQKEMIEDLAAKLGDTEAKLTAAEAQRVAAESSAARRSSSRVTSRTGSRAGSAAQLEEIASGSRSSSQRRSATASLGSVESALRMEREQGEKKEISVPKREVDPCSCTSYRYTPCCYLRRPTPKYREVIPKVVRFSDCF